MKLTTREREALLALSRQPHVAGYHSVVKASVIQQLIEKKAAEWLYRYDGRDRSYYRCGLVITAAGRKALEEADGHV